MKGLRGGAFDIFGRTEERRMERRLIEEYFSDMETVVKALPEADYAIAIALAALPEKIRGYGHVKEASVRGASTKRADLLSRLVPSSASLHKAS